MSRLTDGASQYVWMWAYVGFKTLDANQNLVFHPLYPAQWPFSGPQSFVTFDLNHDGIVNDGDVNRFQVTMNGYGTPFVFHDMYDQFYIIDTWFNQGDSSSRYFWHAWYGGPAPGYQQGPGYPNPDPQDVLNAHWTGATTEPSVYYNEAFWTDQGWSFGSGNMCQLRDGQNWPCQPTTADQYGSFESRAKNGTALWFVHVWSSINGAYEEWAEAPF